MDGFACSCFKMSQSKPKPPIWLSLHYFTKTKTSSGWAKPMKTYGFPPVIEEERSYVKYWHKGLEHKYTPHSQPWKIPQKYTEVFLACFLDDKMWKGLIGMNAFARHCISTIKDLKLFFKNKILTWIKLKSSNLNNGNQADAFPK